MNLRQLPQRVMTVVSVLFFLVGCAAPFAATAPAKPPGKILFVGNSLSYFNSGLDYHLMKLVGSANPSLTLETDRIMLGGATLKRLWDDPSTHDKIAKPGLDAVVLQEDLPETDVATFKEYARLFVAEINKTGARPVLFMAWPYERLGKTTLDDIVKAHHDIAKELGVEVAPVGLAFQRAAKERPSLDMYGSDREHPSMAGTYLAVNVLYATLYGKSPEGLTYLPTEGDLSQDDASFLQRIAWETVQAYQAP